MHVLGCMPMLDKTSIAVGKAEKSDIGQHKPWENGCIGRDYIKCTFFVESIRK